VERALLTLGRLQSGELSNAERATLAARPSFDDAVTLLELLVSVRGRGESEVGVWKELRRRMQAARKETSPSSERRRRRRRPRRRRRRR